MLQASSDYLDSQETPAGGEAQKLGKIQSIVTIIPKKKKLVKIIWRLLSA